MSIEREIGMQTLTLPLRQQKLLQTLQSQNGYITGTELAKQLGVSPRTIRSDIVEINLALAPLEAQILSVKSKGYTFSAKDPQLISQLNKIDTAFLTKEDRVRYLAFQLCLSDIPINRYDLEEEMSISHTTLNTDLHLLKKHYVYVTPHIQLIQQKNYIEFEKDERKRRTILNRLFYVDWNYDGRSNAYYSYHFLEDDILSRIMNEVPKHLNHYQIRLEDTNLVSLNLAIAIMYHRIISGHILPKGARAHKHDEAAANATEDLLNALEVQLDCAFPPQERDAIYQHIASGHLLDSSSLNFGNVSEYFDPVTIEMCSRYLELIKEVFLLDLTNDEDFYISLLQYIRSLGLPVLALNTQGNMDIAKEHLMVEFEFAYLFQKVAEEYWGYYMDQAELLYLAYCLSGALEYFFHHHPEYKLRTIICSQMNLSATWALKRKVLGAFSNYIDATDLMPVNAKDTFDFSNTDLILTTVRKKITDSPNTDTLRISSYLNASDHRKIEAYIQKKRIQRLSPNVQIPLSQLLQEAFWHTKIQPASIFSLMEDMAADFIDNNIVTTEYLSDILRRESISTFAARPGVLLLYSQEPAQKTCLSVSSMQHRIIWNGHKIRLVIMAAFRREDLPLIFHLMHCIYEDYYNLDVVSTLKEKEDILSFYENEPT